jgi:hypothetical protein
MKNFPSAERVNNLDYSGIFIYDLNPNSSDLMAIVGPESIDANMVEYDAENHETMLPDGFRWLTNDEWATIQSGKPLAITRKQLIEG